MGNAITLEDIISFLLEAPMFGDLDSAELSEVVHIMQVQRLRSGQYVFREGEEGDAWYVLYEGQAEVIKNDPDKEDGRGVIAVLGPRSCFGEMGILDGSPRSASVRVKGDSTAFRFPRSDFEGLLAARNLSAYKLVYQIALVLAARQRDTTRRLVDLMHTADDPEVLESIEPIVTEQSTSE